MCFKAIYAKSCLDCADNNNVSNNNKRLLLYRYWEVWIDWAIYLPANSLWPNHLRNIQLEDITYASQSSPRPRQVALIGNFRDTPPYSPCLHELSKTFIFIVAEMRPLALARLPTMLIVTPCYRWLLRGAGTQSIRIFMVTPGNFSGHRLNIHALSV